MSTGKFTLLFSDKGARVEIEDGPSGIKTTIIISPKDTLNMLSRLAMVECDIEWGDTSVIGKQLETEKVDIPVPNNWHSYEKHEKEDLLVQYLEEEGYYDLEFSIKNKGFTTKQNRKGFHQVIIHRWV